MMHKAVKCVHTENDTINRSLKVHLFPAEPDEQGNLADVRTESTLLAKENILYRHKKLHFSQHFLQPDKCRLF